MVSLEQGNKGRMGFGKIKEDVVRAQKEIQIFNKNYVDRRRRPATRYEKDDYVMVRNFNSHPGPSRKLLPKFKGPYRVSKVFCNDRYLLKNIEGFQQSHTPNSGVWAVGNLKPGFRGR